MGIAAQRQAAASRRSARLGVGCALCLFLWSLSRLGGSSQQQAAPRTSSRRALEAPQARPELQRAAAVPRPKYALTQAQLEAAVVAGAERHGPVDKAGPLPPEFWTDAARPGRERAFLEMLKQDMAQPRSARYWGADGVSGELALRPLRLPYPLCHTYVNHKYKVIYITHPKSASTATKRYLTLCRLERTDSCLEPLAEAAQLAPLDSTWGDYYVFTFVRNPWVRAFSSWKFLRQGYMLPPGATALAAGDAPLASGKPPVGARSISSISSSGDSSGDDDIAGSAGSGGSFASSSSGGSSRWLSGGAGGEEAEPCAEAGWAAFCGDPLLLGRTCLAQPHCCPGREGQHFMHYHMTDQATCLHTTDGRGLAVDFIGRVESVDEDMQRVIAAINARLPPGVAPLRLPEEVAALNVGPKSARTPPPSNSRYLPAFQGAANASCFRQLSRFYEKDVELMFPSLYLQEAATYEASVAALAVSQAAAGIGLAQFAKP